MTNQAEFFKALGQRIRDLRRKRGYSQEDMISLDFSARHWQGMEHGHPMTVTTLVRICLAFEISLEALVKGLTLPDKARIG